MRFKIERPIIIVSLLALALAVAAPVGVAWAAEDKNDADGDKEGYVAFTDDHPRGRIEEGKALLYIVRPTSVGFAVKSSS